ncbi:hypothetical protein [Mongoliibacter ruber]|nr:hypothetical protein [Mongoliibacter ruber]
MKIKENEFKKDSEEQIMEITCAGIKELKEVLEGKTESSAGKDSLNEN